MRSAGAVARELGVTRQAVYNFAERHDLLDVLERRASIDPDTVITLVDQGLSAAAIARELNCQPKTVLRLLAKMGVEGAQSLAVVARRKKAAQALRAEDFSYDEICDLLSLSRDMLHKYKIRRWPGIRTMPSRHEIELLHDLLNLGCSLTEAAEAVGIAFSAAKYVQGRTFMSLDEGRALAKSILDGHVEAPQVTTSGWTTRPIDLSANSTSTT